MRTWMASLLVVMVALAGCAGPGQSDSGRGTAPAGGGAGATTPVAPITNVDPCATQMHDLCGALLLHLAATGDLPMSLAELEAGPGGAEVPDLHCPVSKKTYIYNPVGIFMPERRARLVLYDPAPSHAGMRWGIIAEEGDEMRPPVFKVIAFPESFFVLRPPQ